MGLRKAAWSPSNKGDRIDGAEDSLTLVTIGGALEAGEQVNRMPWLQTPRSGSIGPAESRYDGASGVGHLWTGGSWFHTGCRKS